MRWQNELDYLPVVYLFKIGKVSFTQAKIANYFGKKLVFLTHKHVCVNEAFASVVIWMYSNVASVFITSASLP